MQETTADLPETARQLVKLIGYRAALELIRVLGGRTVTFSKGKRPDGQAKYEYIAEIAGQEAADMLAEHFDGVPAYIPRCAKALLIERDRKIREEYDAATLQGSARGAVAGIAERYGMCDRNVWRIVNGS